LTPSLGRANQTTECHKQRLYGKGAFARSANVPAVCFEPVKLERNEIISTPCPLPE